MHMDPLQSGMMGMPGGGMGQSTNLLSIIINIIFGFVIGLAVFWGLKEVIAAGKQIAENLFELSGYGKQMSSFGFATNIAPYVVLTPIVGMVVRQLTSVRSLKSFGYFAAALVAGFILAFFLQAYLKTLL
jgi:hypothetical protein